MSKIKNAAKISSLPRTRKSDPRTRYYNPALFASKPKRVRIEEPGERMYILDAKLTIVPKDGKDGPYEKVYIHGIDAVGGLSINGLEFDGPRFEGSVDFFFGFKHHIKSSGYYEGDGPDRRYVKTGEYRHLGDGFPAPSEDVFWAEVGAEQERLASAPTDSDDGDPDIAV